MKTRKLARQLQNHYSAQGVSKTQNVRNAKPLWELAIENLNVCRRNDKNRATKALTINHLLETLQKQNFLVNLPALNVALQKLRQAEILGHVALPSNGSHSGPKRAYFLTGI